MPITDLSETGQKILIAAESLFAEYGLNGISLRQITAKAGVNLAAVNYHYSDKESLYREIVLLRMREINATRTRELSQAETRAGDSIVSLVEIVEIMARPLFQPSADSTFYNTASLRLLGRIYTDPLPFTDEILAAELQPTLTRFGQAMRRHHPSLSPQDFIWRFSFIVGAMHHTLATLHDMKARTNGVCRNDDYQSALRNFTTFALGALGR